MLVNLPAQDDCREKLADAERRYQAGFYDDALQLLWQMGPCLKGGRLDKEDKIRLYSLKGRAFLAGYYPSQAIKDSVSEAINKILDINMDYEPRAPENPEFEMQVKSIQQKRQAIKKKNRKWYWIGGTAAIVGTGLVIYFSTRPEAEQPLPGPPGLPGSVR